MRIERVEVAGFGCLIGRDFDFSRGLNVVTGPNEAGKSTLLQAIFALLYGFSAGRSHSAGLSQRELGLPWQGDRFSGNLLVLRDDGQRFRLDRDFRQERTKVYRQPGAEDVTSQFNPGRRGLVDFAEQCLRLSASVFQASALIRQEGLELGKGDVDALHGKLESLADSGGVEQSAKKAVEKLDAWLRERVNPLAHAARNSPLLLAEAEVQRLDAELRANREVLENLAQLRADHQEQERTIASYEREIDVIDGAIAWREREELGRKLAKLRDLDADIAKVERDLRAREGDLAGPLVEHEQLGDRLRGLTVERLDHLRRTESEVNVDAVRLRPIAFPLGLIVAIAGVVGLLLGFVAFGTIGAMVGGVGFAALTLVWSMAQKQRGDRDRAVLQKRRKNLATALADFHATSAEDLQTAWNRQNVLAAELRVLAEHQAAFAWAQSERRTLLGGASRDEWQLRRIELARSAVEPGPEERRNRAELVADRDRLREDLQAAALRSAELKREYTVRTEGIADPAEIAERLAVAEEALARVKRTQQALVDATTLISDAATNYRQAFAPRLAQSLGLRLSRTTGGRYSRAEISPKDLTIHVHSAERGALVTLDQLSRGTRDAIALLLRASVVDLLSTGSESVPLFLDDPLVHVDPERCQAILAVLGELATERQIFYFTQDPRIVEWVGAGTTVYELAGQ